MPYEPPIEYKRKKCAEEIEALAARGKLLNIFGSIGFVIALILIIIGFVIDSDNSSPRSPMPFWILSGSAFSMGILFCLFAQFIKLRGVIIANTDSILGTKQGTEKAEIENTNK